MLRTTLPGRPRLAGVALGAVLLAAPGCGDGRFTLTTTTANDGCAVGTHPVTILASESLTPDTTKWHAPQRYADAQTSGLTVSITGPTTGLKSELKGDGGRPAEKANREGGTEFSGFGK
ncbi:hypothetical protein J0H58_03585 [bacterium]|nr:hypothetical protein [bacterium]